MSGTGHIETVLDPEPQPLAPLLGVLMASRWLHGKDELLISYCDSWLEDFEARRFVETMRGAGAQAGAVVFDSYDQRVIPVLIISIGDVPVSDLKNG